jgi:hypothetical protein
MGYHALVRDEHNAIGDSCFERIGSCADPV